MRPGRVGRNTLAGEEAAGHTLVQEVRHTEPAAAGGVEAALLEHKDFHSLAAVAAVVLHKAVVAVVGIRRILLLLEVVAAAVDSLVEDSLAVGIHLVEDSRLVAGSLVEVEAAVVGREDSIRLDEEGRP